MIKSNTWSELHALKKNGRYHEKLSLYTWKEREIEFLYSLLLIYYVNVTEEIVVSIIYLRVIISHMPLETITTKCNKCVGKGNTFD